MKGLVPLRWRRVWAVTRWVAVASALPLIWACNARTLEAPQSTPVRVVNYNGDITDAFTCIAALGDQGCGFEGQLKSVRWALDANAATFPPENDGFLRPEAFLAVILITNEDDCSVPDDSGMVDPTPMSMA